MTNPERPSAVAVRTLRLGLDLTQQQVADLAGVDRLEILSMEKGRLIGSSARMRDGLAKAFGLSHEDMSAALDGSLSAADALNLVLTEREKCRHASRKPRAPKASAPAPRGKRAA